MCCLVRPRCYTTKLTQNAVCLGLTQMDCPSPIVFHGQHAIVSCTLYLPRPPKFVSNILYMVYHIFLGLHSQTYRAPPALAQV